jgi:hypothetical protein
MVEPKYPMNPYDVEAEDQADTGERAPEERGRGRLVAQNNNRNADYGKHSNPAIHWKQRKGEGHFDLAMIC